VKPGQVWKTMSGDNAVIVITNAPDKKCPLLGYIFQERGCIHPCLWDKKGNYFGREGGELAGGKCDLAEPHVELNKKLPPIENVTKGK